MSAQFAATTNCPSPHTIILGTRRSRYAPVAAHNLATKTLEDRTNLSELNGSPRACLGIAGSFLNRPVGIPRSSCDS
jgi:hypothetical protein